MDTKIYSRTLGSKSIHFSSKGEGHNKIRFKGYLK